MSTVAMAVDDTTRPHDVLPTYLSMARKPEHVVLVHVRTPLHAASQERAPGHVTEDASGSALSAIQQALENGHAVRVTAHIRNGVLSEELIRIAEVERADLIIVVGKERASGPTRLLRGGSIAELERLSSVPVIVRTRNTHRHSAEQIWNGREQHAA